MPSILTLCEIARKTLEAHFGNTKFILDEETKKKFSEKKVCFVTLTKNSELGGCIGNLEPKHELWEDVQENAINSAFHDYRFRQLEKDELKDIKIEVSVLTKPKRIKFKDENNLLNKINSKMGIILKKDFNSATFLPQVWKQIPNKIKFLEHLSLKAGLNKDAWKNSEAEFWFYNVEKIGEK